MLLGAHILTSGSDAISQRESNYLVAQWKHSHSNAYGIWHLLYQTEFGQKNTSWALGKLFIVSAHKRATPHSPNSASRGQTHSPADQVLRCSSVLIRILWLQVTTTQKEKNNTQANNNSGFPGQGTLSSGSSNLQKSRLKKSLTVPLAQVPITASHQMQSLISSKDSPASSSSLFTTRDKCTSPSLVPSPEFPGKGCHGSAWVRYWIVDRHCQQEGGPDWSPLEKVTILPQP